MQATIHPNFKWQEIDVKQEKKAPSSYYQADPEENGLRKILSQLSHDYKAYSSCYKVKTV